MAGYSGTPLVKKLGIKTGSSIFVYNATHTYFDLVHPLPAGVVIKETARGSLDFIHLFVKTQPDFEKQFVSKMKCLTKNGMMWVSWPKKSSGVVTDLDENVIRAFGLKQGLVDVKVCAVDEIWSALKFVYKLKDR